MELFKLFGSILVDNDAANKSIDSTEQKAGGLGGKLGSLIGTAAKVGAGIVAGVGIAGAAMLGLANKTAETADYIDKLSERTGINREELQRWKYAADQSGADIGKLEVGIKKLSDTMDEASNGSEKNVEAFAKLGISMEDLKNKSQEQIFDEVMNALAEMPKGAERNALGNDLLGKSYTELMPLLNAGADGMAELKNRADELGLVMSEDAVKAGVKFGDTWADLKDAFGAVFTHLGTELIPIFQALADWILQYMPQIKEFTHTAFDVIRAIVTTVYEIFRDWILPIFSQVFEWAQENMPVFQSIFNTVFGAVWDVVKKLWDFYTESLLPIFKEVFGWADENMPTFRETFENVFNAVWDVVKKVWDFFTDNLFAILKTVFGWVQENMPSFKKIFEDVFGIVKNVVETAWDIFANFLLPILKGLWDFIKPTFPLIEATIGTAFKAVVKVVETVVGIFEKVTDAIKTAIKWLKSWNNEDVEEKKTKGINQNNQLSGSHANGLSYVPYDGYVEVLHTGERVLTATENKQYRGTTYGNIYVTIPAADIKEMQDISDFFGRINQTARAMGV